MRSFVLYSMGAVFFVGLAMLGSSCSALPRVSKPAVSKPAPTETQIIAETARQAQEQVAAGRHKRALEIYSSAYDKNPLPGLKQGYSRLGERIRTASDTAFQNGKFMEAGNDYRILLESGITTRDFAGSLSFDNDYLRRQIEACSKGLMETGLIKYREEKLDEAIAIWKKVLLFDGDNKNVKNAIDTAYAQLQQLKKIK